MNKTQTPAALDEATTRYDAAFREVHGLTWLPWVGQRFSERQPNQRLLVVGESHYFIGDTPEERESNRDKWLKEPEFTREIVSEALIGREWPNKTLDTIPKLLFKTTEIDRLRLWGDSAFYNFVQRFMDHFVEQQPTPDDFLLGWRVFAEVVRIIKPSHCLFIGVRAADHFNLGTVLRHEKIDGVAPRFAKLEIAGTTTELIFVHHLARCKKLSLWHDYLQSHHANFMNWLGAESYPNSLNP